MKDKRTVDMQVMREWIAPETRVLDLGCGRGVLLDYLKQKRSIQAVGVDMDEEKVRAGIKRGLSIYMGDMMEFMKSFSDKHFDYVICSRTIQELNDPRDAILEALRVSEHLLIGFVNFGYWRNRVNMALRGERIQNEVFPTGWSESRPINPLSVDQFERFCRTEGIEIARMRRFKGDWTRDVRLFPNLFCGYAIYDLRAGLRNRG